MFVCIICMYVLLCRHSLTAYDLIHVHFKKLAYQIHRLVPFRAAGEHQAIVTHVHEHAYMHAYTCIYTCMHVHRHTLGLTKRLRPVLGCLGED